MPQDRYTIAQAQEALKTTKSSLELWIRKAGLRKQINGQRLEDDMRQHFLTLEQLERLAGLHRRTLALDGSGALDTEAIDSALSERLEALEQKVERLTALVAPSSAPRVSPDVSFDAQRPQNRIVAPRIGHAAVEGVLSKAEAARLVADRHTVNFRTVRQWPWSAEALASAEAAEAWAVDYVARTPRHKRPPSWRP